MVKQTAVRAGIAKGRALGFWLTYVSAYVSGVTLAYHLWSRFPSTALAKTILNNGNFDWVLIDGEHGLISDKDYYDVSGCSTPSWSAESPLRYLAECRCHICWRVFHHPHPLR